MQEGKKEIAIGIFTLYLLVPSSLNFEHIYHSFWIIRPFARSLSILPSFFHHPKMTCLASSQNYWMYLTSKLDRGSWQHYTVSMKEG